MADMKTLVGDVLETSQVLAEVKAVNAPKGKSILFGDKVRALKPEEIQTLEKQRCSSSDWGKILVAEGFCTKSLWDTYFAGTSVLGVFKKSDNKLGDGTTIPAGLYRSIVVNSEIGNDATIHNVGNLNNVVVKDGAVVASVTQLTAAEGTNFGIGRELPIANEVGGRDVALYPELTVGVAEKISRSRKDKDLIESYGKFVVEYAEKAKSKKGIVCAGARVTNTGRVVDSFVGPGAVIDNATAVVRSVLLSLPDEKSAVLDGAYVCDSILQWGADATTMAIVDRSILCEHSHAERHGKVTDSIVGPNSGVAEGECTASLLGPFVGFHHQSLIIAAMWPEGKGNVGYGANVGSNHTAKAPDQEIWCGEGTFFGLSVNVKFPCNFSGSPYSILASGVTCLPQKFDFPFSLINSPAAAIPGASPMYNEVMPGWVLSDNIYMVMRNEGKYMDRNKAKREKFVFEVFRPDIVDLMIGARKRLDIPAESRKDFYLADKMIKGLAKNYMSEQSRVAGIEAYTFYIRYYALKGLFRKVSELAAAGKIADVAKVLDTQTSCPRWEHERKVLAAEFPGDKCIATLLRKLADMQNKIATDVEQSKKKDDDRGARIIPDYVDSHKPASDDKFVKTVKKQTAELVQKVDELVKQLK